MEIEAKFVIANDQLFTELTGINGLGHYTVGAFEVRHLRDSYLDTEGRALTRVRWVCRRREFENGEGAADDHSQRPRNHRRCSSPSGGI